MPYRCTISESQLISILEMKKEQPLSPHLSIYKPIPTMVMSIVHRITGMGLYVGSVIFVAWLVASTNPNTLQVANNLLTSIVGQVILILYVWALVHHMLGGIKHLIQDTGRLLSKEATTRIAIAQPIVSVAVTATLWTTKCLVGV